MLQDKITIAIDGPSSSGKGTITKKLANHLKIPCLNTGGLYRAVAYLALSNNLHPEKDFAKILQLKQEILEINPDSDFLHNEEVAKMASNLAIKPEIRQMLIDAQANFINDSLEGNNGVIIEGRDIGTVIMPDAKFKFFITASAKIRAKRRYSQMIKKGLEADFAKILEQIEKRDFADKNRKSSPLKQADDAILIDTSNLDIDEVFAEIISVIPKLIFKKGKY